MLYVIILMLAVLAVVSGIMAYLILLERKVAAWIQDRYGPNRCGPRGLLQPIADGLKMLFKEDYTPGAVAKVLFYLAPCLLFFTALCAIAIIPFGGQVRWHGRVYDLQIAQINIGILYILALSSLSVYGVVLGGWASNSKFSLLGAMRAAAQLLGYEIPLTLAILNVVLLAGTLRLDEIIQQQIQQGWNVLWQPLTFLIFIIASFGETKRLPFDLPETEQELVGGYHTEYSSMRFGMFFLGEYVHVIVVSAVAVVLFFGGWHFPGLSAEPATLAGAVLRVAIFLAKLYLFIFLFMWVRWTLPRFRFDQVLRLAWKTGLTAGLALLIANILIIALLPLDSWTSRLAQLAANIGILLALTLAGGLNPQPVGMGNIPVEMKKMEQLY